MAANASNNEVTKTEMCRERLIIFLVFEGVSISTVKFAIAISASCVKGEALPVRDIPQSDQIYI